MKQRESRLCLVEDDPIMGESLRQRFALEGIACDWYQNGLTALQGLKRREYIALLSDIKLPDTTGEHLYTKLIELGVSIPATIFITGFGTIDQAVRLLKLGAHDYITKPFDLDELLDKLRSVAPALFVADDQAGLDPVLGVSPVMRSIQGMMARLADHQTNVLITGESGVGKEYAAYYLHCKGSLDEQPPVKGSKPFVAINCAALSESLLEAELFGHEKGAFTGAARQHRGVFEQADGGTLFLDEVGEMTPLMQAKLLRVLQDQRVQRVGGEQFVQVNVRLVCATNRDLKEMVEAGDFREDLYYRLNVIHVHIPPLRDRKEDILWFAHKFLQRFSEQQNERHYLLPNSERCLSLQRWPGNIRELSHTLERACLLSTNEMLGPADFGGGCLDDKAETIDYSDLRTFLSDREREHLINSLKANDWKITKTAAVLGISRKSLWEKMKKYGLDETQHLADI